MVYSASVRTAGLEEFDESGALVAAAPMPAPADGEAIAMAERELGSIELFPTGIHHNNNGRFVVAVGDNEYVIYTAQTLRNKDFGAASEFVWSAFGTGDYAVYEPSSRNVKVFKNFKEVHSFRPPVDVKSLSGGSLLCVRSTEHVLFYDWETMRLVRRIEVAARGVVWNDAHQLVAILADDSYFVLRFDRDEYTAGMAASVGTSAMAVVAEEGVESAFELQHQIEEKVRNGVWVGDCFLYTNAANRLNYYVGGEVMTLSHLDRSMYVLGYLAKEGRVYLMDKAGVIVSYALLLAVLNYQTAVVRRNFTDANAILPDIPRDQYNSIARFLDSQGFKEEALAVAQDPDVKFDLAVQLGKLDFAYNLLKVQSAAEADSTDDQLKWKTLTDLALARCDLALAEECATAARDASALLLLHSSTGSAKGMRQVAALAKEQGRFNIAFTALHALADVDACAQLIADSGRLAEVRPASRSHTRTHTHTDAHERTSARAAALTTVRTSSACIARVRTRAGGVVCTHVLSEPSVCAHATLEGGGCQALSPLGRLFG